MFTDKQVAQALKDIVEANPYYRYESPDGEECYYMWNGAPSCGIGHLLHRLGLDAGRANELMMVSEGRRKDWDYIQHSLPGVSLQLIYSLWEFQDMQDSTFVPYTWQEAYAEAGIEDYL